jgi:hypothetical protein
VLTAISMSTLELQSKYCCTQIPHKQIGLMALWLTFGGTPCSKEWNIISETICNLATALLDNNWNPSKLQTLGQENFPPPNFLSDDIPFAEGKELIINVAINDQSTHDIYIDDFIGLSLDLPRTDNRQWCEAAPLLAIDLFHVDLAIINKLLQFFLIIFAPQLYGGVIG